MSDYKAWHELWQDYFNVIKDHLSWEDELKLSFPNLKQFEIKDAIRRMADDSETARYPKLRDLKQAIYKSRHSVSLHHDDPNKCETCRNGWLSIGLESAPDGETGQLMDHGKWYNYSNDLIAPYVTTIPCTCHQGQRVGQMHYKNQDDLAANADLARELMTKRKEVLV